MNEETWRKSEDSYLTNKRLQSFSPENEYDEIFSTLHFVLRKWNKDKVAQKIESFIYPPQVEEAKSEAKSGSKRESALKKLFSRSKKRSAPSLKPKKIEVEFPTFEEEMDKASGAQELLKEVAADEVEEKEVSVESSQQELINGLIRGDNASWSYLYHSEFPKIHSFIYQNSGNHEQAQEIFQESMVILLEKIYQDSLDLNCRIGTYLYSISRNLWLAKLKRATHSIPLEWETQLGYEVVDIDFPIEDERDDMIRKIAPLIDNLGEKCKKMINMFYFENKNWDEIALALDYTSAANARNQKYKCLEQIRKNL